tara:strand:- start:2 stop:550 length:549 start_codon:yes stop_codon:yes gene_type:complete
MKKLLSLSLILLILSSCKQSNDVVGTGFLQKRKYRTGFHLQKRNHHQQIENKSMELQSIEALAVNNAPEPTIEVFERQKENIQENISTEKRKRTGAVNKRFQRLSKTKQDKPSKKNINPETEIEEEEEEEEEERIKQNKTRLAISLVFSIILLFTGPFVLIPITLLVNYFFEFRATKNLKPY